MALNVLGGQLDTCSLDPITGYLRDGCCNTSAEDLGSHTVCSVVTVAFLEFSRLAGNDLSTPRPEFGFAGLSPGDGWCVCAGRWLEAHNAGSAPGVRLSATHERALETVPLDLLQAYAVDG